MAKLDDEYMFVNLEKAYKKFGKRAEEKTDKAVFTCIAEYTNPEGKAFVSQNTIADETGYARRTVANSIHRLAEKNLLTIEKTLTDNTGIVRGIASNIYHINPKYLTHTKPAQRGTKPQCSACVKPCGSNMNDMRGFAQLGEVMADVIKNIFALYEEKNK